MQPTRQLQAGRHRIALYERRPHNPDQHKPVLFFLHGNCLSSEIWAKQWDDAQLAEYPLIAMDLPGHGHSAPSAQPDRDYSLPGYADVVGQVLACLKLERYVLAGYSLGANIAVEMLPLPKGCLGLFMTGFTLTEKPLQLEKVWFAHPALDALFQPHPTEEQAADYLRLLYRHGTDVPPAALRDFQKADARARTHLAQSLGAGRYADACRLLESARIPVALALGAEDQILRTGYLAQQPFPKWGGQPHLIPEAGHSPQWENAQAFDRLLVAFAEEADA